MKNFNDKLKQETLFSIIIPCYNTSKYIVECLDSVINQTMTTNYEIICIDDCSTDTTLDILNSYKQKYNNIIVEKLAKNSGQSIARNRALELAQGKYICFLDSDDKFRKDYFEKIYFIVSQTDLDILYINGSTFFDSEKLKQEFGRFSNSYKRPKLTNITSGKNALLYFWNRNDNTHALCTYIFKREFILKHNIKFVENIIYEDTIFNISASLYAQHVYNIIDEIYLRRVRENSTMTEEKTFKNFISYMSVCINITRAIKLTCDITEKQFISNIISNVLKPIFLNASHLYYMYVRNKKVFKDMYKYNDAQQQLQLYFELSKKDLTQIQTYYSILKD